MSAGAGAGRSSDPCAARLPALANSTLASLVRCGAVAEQGSAGSLAAAGGGVSFAGNGVGGGLHDAAASGQVEFDNRGDYISTVCRRPVLCRMPWCPFVSAGDIVDCFRVQLVVLYCLRRSVMQG